MCFAQREPEWFHCNLETLRSGRWHFSISNEVIRSSSITIDLLIAAKEQGRCGLKPAERANEDLGLVINAVIAAPEAMYVE